MAPEARVAFAAAPIMSAARIPSARPTTAPLRPRAPDTMIDTSPSARLPGYTGHVPGITSDSLLGRSYAYTTGFRKDLLSASEAHISEYKRAVAEGTHFAPKQYTRVVDASKVSRPMQAPDALRGWKSKEQYNQTLDLSADGRMPGYTGHVPHFKFQGSVGLPFAKACQYKDHLRPADGSHNVYKHEEPHHKGGVKHTAEPATGYSGYMPFVQTQGMNVPYMRNVDLSVQLRKVNPADLRKDLDQTNAAYTPSMHEVCGFLAVLLHPGKAAERLSALCARSSLVPSFPPPSPTPDSVDAGSLCEQRPRRQRRRGPSARPERPDQ
jgi:hypothetical protein